jgi:AraC-like DNA-binding protein
MTTSAAPAAPERIEFETTDPARAIEYLSSAYRASLQVSGLRAGFLFRHSRADGGSFALDEVRMPVDLTVRQEPLQSLVIVQIDAGRMERACGEVSERFVSGDVFVDAEPSLPATLRLLEVVTQTVVLDLAVLTQVAATSPTRVAGPIRLTSYQPTSVSAALQWQRTVTYLRDLLANTEAAAQPLIRGNAARMLAATVLATFPNTAVIDPTAQDRHDATGTTVRRATAFIEQHPDEDISVADIAAAANVSIRAVQFAFRRQLDTTPMAYLRTVRLDHAHHDLLATDPSRGDTVTGIAARWGFYSNSRFATRYRRAYGVSPRDTLLYAGLDLTAGRRRPRQVGLR